MGQLREPDTIAITGAAGFIGRHAVRAARRRGVNVHAIVRTLASVRSEWSTDPGVTPFVADLSSENSIVNLQKAVSGASAVIHAAAALTGSEADQTRDTVTGTRNLIRSLEAERVSGIFVLVSSLTVYDSTSVAVGELLDESAEIEQSPALRDAYCRVKLAQEELVREWATTTRTHVRIMRPGAVFGPGRLMNGHIGPGMGPVLFQIGKRGDVPVSFVEHCAEALVLAALRPPNKGQGLVECYNVLDSDLPDRNRFTKALRGSGWPRIIVPVPWSMMAFIAKGLSFVPGLNARLPGLLRPAIQRTRLMPLRYSNDKLMQQLGWVQSMSFEDAVDCSIASQNEGAAYAR